MIRAGGLSPPDRAGAQSRFMRMIPLPESRKRKDLATRPVYAVDFRIGIIATSSAPNACCVSGLSGPVNLGCAAAVDQCGAESKVKPQRHCEKEVAFGSRAIKLVGSYWRVPIPSGTGGTIAITDSTFVNGGSVETRHRGQVPAARPRSCRKSFGTQTRRSRVPDAASAIVKASKRTLYSTVDC
jgi:hypothetical protein